jgi:hypothetical protein
MSRVKTKMNVFLTRVYDIALAVRAEVEVLAHHRGDDREDLNGWCAIASGKLHNRLVKEGIDRAEIHMASDNQGSCHVFLMVDDHVLDITATQFQHFLNEAVLIRHHREVDHHWYYESSQMFRTAKELRKNQLKTGWTKKQICYG